MAEKALKKLEEQLSCAICLDIYNEPKVLQCSHEYCRACLVKLVVRNDQGELVLPCPTCRKPTLIPPNGVSGLQPAFRINCLLEIYDSFKEVKDPAEKIKSDTTHPIASKKALTDNCSDHADKERELYCETCGDLVCIKCLLQGGKHFTHDCHPLDEAFERYKQEMVLSLKPMEEKLVTINEILARIEVRYNEVSDQGTAVEETIYDTFGRLQDILEVRKTELVSKLHHLAQEKLKSLEVQKDHIKAVQTQLSSSLDFVKESMTTGNQNEALQKKSNVTNQVKVLSAAFQPDILEPNTEADMVFMPAQDAIAVCQHYGQVYESSSPDPSRYHAEGKGLEVAVVGERSSAVMLTLNSEKGKPYSKPPRSLQCELISQITSIRVNGMFEKKEDNCYEVSYKPISKGKHYLSIKVDEQHIRGSPFPVTVKLPLEKLGTPILSIDGLESPYGMAVNQRGEVVVAESGRHCVSIFSPGGKKLQSFGTYGSNPGEFMDPRDVAVDGNGNILVIDKRRLQKFTMDGRFLAEGKDYLHLKNPYGITVNARNNKVYVVDYNHRVLILNSDLTFFGCFGKHGSGKGQLDCPGDVSCDNSGNILVADSRNHRIQVFTAKGKFIRMFGKCGACEGEIIWPTRVAMDTNDFVYVSEGHNHRVSVFTSGGQFVTSFGGMGKGPGLFECPLGLAVSNGVVYVCDSSNRVQAF